jgi:hypothetical protein
MNCSSIPASQLGLYTTIVLATSACSPTLNDTTWQETVRLASGEELHVKHHVRFREDSALGGGSTGQAFDPWFR